MDAEQQSSIEQLKLFSVCNVIDGLGNSLPIETGIRPVDPSFRICGRALTVECAPGDNLTVHHALHLAQPGDVLVVAGALNEEGALWGELMSISAQWKKLAGTIIDGRIRDPLEIRAIGYPVFCREFDPRRASKQKYGKLNIEVRIGSITVQPGEIVVADANGIICMPASKLHEAVQLAIEVTQRENEIKDQIRSGRSIFEIFSLQSSVRLD